MTGRCPECGHDPASDELERRCEQLEEENRWLRQKIEAAVEGLVAGPCPYAGGLVDERGRRLGFHSSDCRCEIDAVIR